MIRVYILNVEKLMRSDFCDLVDSLPFGDAEKSRLISIGNSKHKWESLGGLIALSRLTDKCSSDFSDFSPIIERAPSGKPYFRSPGAPYFGISHSCGIAAAAISDCKYGEIGFDIEVINKSYDIMRISDRYFTDEEKAEFKSSGETAESFFSIWTAKEAKAKLDGRGLSAIISDKSQILNQHLSLSRLSIDIGDRRTVLSICSYVAGQPVQIYTDSEDKK